MYIKPPSKHQKKRFLKFLSQGEQLIFATGIGKRYFWISLFILLFIPLILTYAGIFMFAGYIQIEGYLWLKFIFIPALLLLIYNTPKYSHLLRMRQSLNYLLTNRRFLIVSGIFTRKIVTAPLTRITHVTIEQSFFQRFLFDSGNILIITAGFDQREIVIDQIGCPINFKILVEELTDKLEESMEKDEEPQEGKLRSLSD